MLKKNIYNSLKKAFLSKNYLKIITISSQIKNVEKYLGLLMEELGEERVLEIMEETTRYSDKFLKRVGYK